MEGLGGGGGEGYCRGLLDAIYAVLPASGRVLCRGPDGVLDVSRLPGVIARLLEAGGEGVSSPGMLEGVGGRLFRMREGRGYSQTMLSVLSGVKQSTISNLELGKQKARGGTVRKLAKALGCSAEELLGTLG